MRGKVPLCGRTRLAQRITGNRTLRSFARKMLPLRSVASCEWCEPARAKMVAPRVKMEVICFVGPRAKLATFAPMAAPGCESNCAYRHGT
jgi:hypothetical protein